MSKNRIKNATIEELMEKLEYCGHDGYYNELYYPVIEEIKRRLKKPKEQPERKHGRWIYEEDGTIHGHCSCCGFKAIYQETDVFNYDYCPNCGARLEGCEQ